MRPARTNMISFSRMSWTKARVYISLLGLLFMPAAEAPAEILIDGSIDDWSGVKVLPITDMSPSHDAPLGAIRFMKIDADDDFIYVLVGFEVARPVDSRTDRPSAEIVGWDDYSYIELDVDGDGFWDYQTRMMPGKRIGRNNLAVVQRIGTGRNGKIVLQAEGHKDYFPLGPRGFFLLGSRAVEQRIPRLPLGLTEGTIFVRGCVHYRDVAQGSGNWVSEYFPGPDQWIGLELQKNSRGFGAGERSAKINRELEPVALRADFELMIDKETPRLRSDLIYPRPRPILSSADSEAAASARGKKKTRAHSVITVVPGASSRPQAAPGIPIESERAAPASPPVERPDTTPDQSGMPPGAPRIFRNPSSPSPGDSPADSPGS